VGPLPFRRNGFITFGSLQNVLKFQPAVYEDWASILKEVSSARLMLALPKQNPQPAKERVLEDFNRVGIEESRLILLPRMAYATYLQTYNEIDIVLDTFPWTGHTTTCDALWMGCPVVTRSGETHVTRLASDVLHHIGLDGWITTTSQSFRKTAILLASNPDELEQFRSTSRQLMMRSAVLDAPSLAREIETAIRHAWNQYLQSPSPT
jgi:predicted O-linked N-acetylglucosamine transferase (SPINDLY family)